MRWTGLLFSLWLLFASVLQAGEHQTFECATSEDVRKALEIVQPGDTIVLQGGSVYEIDAS